MTIVLVLVARRWFGSELGSVAVGVAGLLAGWGRPIPGCTTGIGWPPLIDGVKWLGCDWGPDDGRRWVAVVYDAGGCRDAGDSGWRDTGGCRDADAVRVVGDGRDTGVVDLFLDKTWLYVGDFGICVATVLPCDFPFLFVTLVKPALFPGQSSRVSINKPAMSVIFSRNLAWASRISVTILSVLSVWLLHALPSVYFRMPLYREISRLRESLSLYKRLISLFCLFNIFLKLSNSDFCSV